MVSGRIYSLAVEAGQRGKGVGGRLLEAMVARMAERGVRRVYLEVEEVNGGAVRLYERSGFRRIGVLPDYYGAGKTGLHMVKELGTAVVAKA
jgi:ribosomal protein S18 acetylase RimI-like enzyme